ncbi:MAG: hypothetical protein ABFQ65_03790 [Nanoarchaeota archaeon]
MKRILLILVGCILLVGMFAGCVRYKELSVRTNKPGADVYIKDIFYNRWIITDEDYVVDPHSDRVKYVYLRAGKAPLKLYVYSSSDDRRHRNIQEPDIIAVWPDGTKSEHVGEIVPLNNQPQLIVIRYPENVGGNDLNLNHANLSLSAEVQQEKNQSFGSTIEPIKQESTQVQRRENSDFDGDDELKPVLSFQMSPLVLITDSDVQKIFRESVYIYRGAVGFQINRFRLEAGYDKFDFIGYNYQLILTGPEIAGALVFDDKYGGVGLFSGKAKLSGEYTVKEYPNPYHQYQYTYKTVKVNWEGEASGIRVFFGRTFFEHLFIESSYYILQVHPKDGNDYDEDNLDVSHLSVSFGARF